MAQRRHGGEHVCTFMGEMNGVTRRGLLWETIDVHMIDDRSGNAENTTTHTPCVAQQLHNVAEYL